MKRTNHLYERRRVAAFTLIELLVVIAIIGILAALLFPALAAVNRNKQIKLAQAELQAIAQAIEGYHTKLGFYPPDNPGNPMTNQLYFELLGTTNNGSGTTAPTKYGTLDGSAQILTTVLSNYFGVQGFANSSTRAQSDDQGSAASTFITHLLPNQYAALDPVGAPNILILTCPVAWPSTVPAIIPSNPTLNPYRYVSSHPTNNTGSFDLWVDVVFGHKTNRVCNWSSQPIIQ
jgi:prepilin-type N-terminal cleavage/methylation domain-containing protein